MDNEALLSLGPIGDWMVDQQEATADMAGRLDELSIEKHKLDDLHIRLQAFQEAHHEREVLQPIFLTLITLMDRCQDEIKAWSSQDSVDVEPLIAARKADAIEIESTLKRLGVEPFQLPGDQINVKFQRCIKTIPCSEVTSGGSGSGGARPLQIAERLRPGYRRNKQLIRSEYVTTYVSH